MTGAGTSEHIPPISPLDDRDEFWVSEYKETPINKTPENAFSQVGIFEQRTTSDIDIIGDLDPYLGSPAMYSTESLDLASAAKSSLALLGVVPSNSSTLNKDSPTTTEPSVFTILGDTDLGSSGSPLCDMPIFDSVSPCATTNTTPSPITSRGKKRRIKLLTPAHPSEPADDIESTLAPKKCRITVKVKPRNVSEKEHVGGDITPVQGRETQAEIEKVIKTRIVLKTGSCQSYSHRPTTLNTSLSGTTSSRSKWTLEEDETIRRMKHDNCSWIEIQRALPHRSLGSMQVRYSTKLK
ncbi:hypothetical protein H9Q69_013046 [Fusarium xylarioides]|nr:hypothetical protein H9Q69_013046 [Fusarium xylarioides]